MHYNTLITRVSITIKASFSELPEQHFRYDLENNFENNLWSLEHNAEKLQEIQNRINARDYEHNYLRPTVLRYFMETTVHQIHPTI